MADQAEFWNFWNAQARESSVGQVSLDQRRVVLSWLERLGCSDFDLIEVGCGAGWLCADLARFGRVTGTDLADEIIARAAQRVPQAVFVPGDFMELDLKPMAYDIAVTLEVLSHVVDQRAFLSKIAELLRPGGYLMLATQNRPALERNDIPRPAPGQIRHWVDRHELRALLELRFDVLELSSITPSFNSGVLRYVNSKRLKRLLSNIRLGAVNDWIRDRQEKAWLGWTLMALARRR